MRRSRPLRGRHGRHDLGFRSRKGEAGGGLCLTVASGHLLHPTETASGTIAASGRAPRWAQRGRPEAPGSLPLRGLPRGCRAGALAVRPPWDAPRSTASAPSAAPAPPAAHVGPRDDSVVRPAARACPHRGRPPGGRGRARSFPAVSWPSTRHTVLLNTCSSAGGAPSPVFAAVPAGSPVFTVPPRFTHQETGSGR